MAVAITIGELDLDLDAFEGPFDLLLTLVLRDELPLCDVDLAEIVIAFLDYLAERDRLDLDACGEFLVLFSALLELKARGLFPDEELELAELEPEEAAEELARRLAEYRRAKDGAGWLAKRLAESSDRYFRLGPAPLAPVAPEPVFAPQKSGRLVAVLRALATEPPTLSTAHMALEFPPVDRFLEQWRSLLRRRTRLDFDQEVEGLSRVEVAVAFMALLELARQHELAVSQARAFAPIRITRSTEERNLTWNAHSA